MLAPQLLLLVLLLCGPATALIPCPDNAGCVIIDTDGVGNDVPAFFHQVRFCSRHRSRQVFLACVSAANGTCPASELWMLCACCCHGSGCTALCVEVQLTCLVNHCLQALSDPTVTEVVLASARFRLKVSAWSKYTANNPLILQRNVTVRSSMWHVHAVLLGHQQSSGGTIGCICTATADSGVQLKIISQLLWSATYVN